MDIFYGQIDVAWKYNDAKRKGGDSYKRSTRKIQIRKYNNMVVSRKRKLGYTFGKVSRKLVSVYSQKSYFTLFKGKMIGY